MRRGWSRLAAGALAAVSALPGGGASGAEAPLVLTPAHGPSRPLMWSGRAEAAPREFRTSATRTLSEASGARHRVFVPSLRGSARARVALWVHWDTPEDLAVAVRDSSGAVVASSDEPAGTDESLVFDVADGAGYTVEVTAAATAPAAAGYEAALWIRSIAGVKAARRAKAKLSYAKPNVCGDSAYRFDEQGRRVAVAPPPCYAVFKVPVNIVFVGFDRKEVADHAPEVAGQFPDPDPRGYRIKPVILDESQPGGAGVLAREGGATVRQAVHLAGGGIAHLPYAFDFGTPNIVVADERYSRRLFAAANEATVSGDYAHPSDRAYLERYNARASASRGDRRVAPQSPVDFIDAMRLEDWIARNPPPGLAFDLAKTPLQFTYFVLDTYRPPYAGRYFDLSRYHNFRVMNSLTVDPDTAEQRGFDWGRVWGGRYRFMILDTGAAPNSFEGATATGVAGRPGAGDSALIDPPVWEFSNCAAVDCRDLLPLYYQRIGENAVSALYLRFARGYASRPRASDRFALAASTWIDAAATSSPPRFDAARVAGALRSLTPYSPVEVARAGRRSASAEQAVLDQARSPQRGRTPAAADPRPLVRHVERNRGIYAPVARGTQAIPVVNAVVAGATRFEGAGGAVRIGREPWGLVQASNDLDAAAAGGLGPAAPFPAAGGFTGTAIRDIGRALGLFPATEGIAYTRDLPPDLNTPRPHPPKREEQHRAYYRTVDWTHATTATPMTTAFTYGRFEVLDRDAIGLAHAMDWLDRALEDVADAFAVLDGRGFAALPQAASDQVARAGRHMGAMVAWAQAGQTARAVAEARAAKRETERLVALALRARRR